MTGRGERLLVGILAMLGILFIGARLGSPAWASGGGGSKESEAAEAVLESTRRPSPVVDAMDVLISEAALKAKDAGEEREIERHVEPLVTPLTLALSPPEGAIKGEAAEKPPVEIKRHLELTAPKPPPEEDARGKKKKEAEGEGEVVPAEIEATRHPEATVSKLAALLEKIEPAKAGEGEAEPPVVDMERHEEPVIDKVSLAFTKAATSAKGGGEGEGAAGGVVEFERHPHPYFQRETSLQARLKNDGKKGEGGEVESEAEFARHPDLQFDGTEVAIAAAAGATKGEGSAEEVEFERKPGLVIDEVDVALDKMGGKARGEGEGAAGPTDIERKPEPVASEAEIPGLETAEDKEHAKKTETEAARPSPEPQYGQILTPHGAIGEQPAPLPVAPKARPARHWPGRDLSTPARRLIGHWTFRLGSVQGDYWFAPLAPGANRGGLVVNDQGTLRRGTWRLVKEDLQAQTVTVSTRLLSSDPFTFPIPEDGATLIEFYSPESALTLEYADQGTAPGVARGRRAGTSPQGARPSRNSVARGAGSSRHE